MTTTLDISMVTYIKLLEADKEFENHGLSWLSYGLALYSSHEADLAYKKFKQHYNIKYMRSTEYKSIIDFSVKSVIRLYFTSEEHLCWFKLKYL